MPNVNPETGVRYGIISANSICPEVVYEIQMDGIDVYWREECKRIREEVDAGIERGDIRPEDREETIDMLTNSIGEAWEVDEPVHEFNIGGVKGRTTWLGGAMLVWVFDSPYTGTYKLCSPCVPNCGDLDAPSPDGEVCYDVPEEWREKE